MGGKKSSQFTLAVFLRFFSSACKLKNQVGTAYMGVYCLSIWIRSKPKKRGSSFCQVIPTRIKVFRRHKNTENGRSHGCLPGAEGPEDRSPGPKEHCHLWVSCYAILLSHKAIYQLGVWSRVLRTWLRCADTTYLWAMQDPGNPP